MDFSLYESVRCQVLGVRKNCETFILRCDRQVMAAIENQELKNLTLNT
ncbi:Uncharacterized protein dnm_095780 [Desulfonema magnum]|uniref:Uncharacterized protein n=1 Tax=Desulfonema magnum TaxID=45655 RepID=A0A975GTY4_9BACT|nr:Uncharacterized protein dnm_095780 [Desulfonema magnum]